ncbi:hypothetical protein DL546_008495 [Coniochaeta pulveracea]|uniref:FAD/NAD(P)-binding domain-containing protein n=1 Tax=Coniochaeta pulveracea TaxID=177199 RepID=A0A420YE34_9PEZI|nr:hypothetical protein DL546_008495 [Coniochaeta pulveracea]
MNIYLKYRKGVEQNFWRGFDGWLKDSHSNNEARQDLISHITERLVSVDRPGLVNDLVPDFSPHCRRLTPGPGYLEAITADNVDYIQTHIKRFTETGIETVDGKHREVDAIFAATGANVDAVPPFSIKANGRDIAQLWSKDGRTESATGTQTWPRRTTRRKRLRSCPTGCLKTVSRPKRWDTFKGMSLWAPYKLCLTNDLLMSIYIVSTCCSRN